MKILLVMEKDSRQKIPDLRDGMLRGMVGPTTNCNFAGQPPAVIPDGASIVTSDISVHAVGQVTHQ